MDINDSYTLIRQTMDDNGLTDWTFQFDNAVRRFGCCHYQQKLITMSRVLIGLNDEAEVLETIRHEVAHALAPKGSGHNADWKRIAVRLGCTGGRMVENVKAPAARWRATCPECGGSYARNRRSKKPVACARCCNKYNYGNFDFRFMFVWTENVDFLAESA